MIGKFVDREKNTPTVTILCALRCIRTCTHSYIWFQQFRLEQISAPNSGTASRETALPPFTIQLPSVEWPLLTGTRCCSPLRTPATATPQRSTFTTSQGSHRRLSEARRLSTILCSPMRCPGAHPHSRLPHADSHASLLGPSLFLSLLFEVFVTLLLRFQVPEKITCALWGPTNDTVYFCSEDGSICIFDVAMQKVASPSLYRRNLYQKR